MGILRRKTAMPSHRLTSGPRELRIGPSVVLVKDLRAFSPGAKRSSSSPARTRSSDGRRVQSLIFLIRGTGGDTATGTRNSNATVPFLLARWNSTSPTFILQENHGW